MTLESETLLWDLALLALDIWCVGLSCILERGELRILWLVWNGHSCETVARVHMVTTPKSRRSGKEELHPLMWFPYQKLVSVLGVHFLLSHHLLVLLAAGTRGGLRCSQRVILWDLCARSCSLLGLSGIRWLLGLFQANGTNTPALAMFAGAGVGYNRKGTLCGTDLLK